MKEEETDDNSHGSGTKTISSGCLESNREAVAIADPECGSTSLEGKEINSFTSSCVLINIISMGYIFNPSGKGKEIK
jgi:hypothetical protein